MIKKFFTYNSELLKFTLLLIILVGLLFFWSEKNSVEQVMLDERERLRDSIEIVRGDLVKQKKHLKDLREKYEDTLARFDSQRQEETIIQQRYEQEIKNISIDTSRTDSLLRDFWSRKGL